MTRNEQLEELRYAMRQIKDKRLFERYQSVLLHLEGKNNIEIASIIQRNRATVSEYIKAYKIEQKLSTTSKRVKDIKQFSKG